MRQVGGDHAAAADEAARRLEILVNAGRLVAEAEVTPVAVEGGRPDRRGCGAAVDDSTAAAGLQLQVVDRSEQQPRIGGEHAIGAGAVDPVGVDEADLRGARQVVLDARDGEQRMIDAAGRGRRIVHRRQQRDIGAGALAGQLDRGQRRGDPARVDQVVGRVEQLGAVEKERALLRKEQRAARIEGELTSVGLDLREIRIDGAVQRQVRRDPPADVAAELGAAGGRSSSRRRPPAGRR